MRGFLRCWVRFNPIPRLIVLEPLIAVSPMLPFMVLSLLVMTKSAAMTGVDKARQTKADVPNKPTLREFKLIVLTLSIDRMESVLEEESLNERLIRNIL